LLVLTLLAGSFIPAQAASFAQASSGPDEALPRWLSLESGGIGVSTLAASGAPANQAEPALSWNVPVHDTCVVYSSLDTSTLQFDLFAFNPANGAYRRVLASSESEFMPHFNHGCTRILYTATPVNTSKKDLFTINPDGSGMVRLTHNQGLNANGAWSHDGSKIAFASDRDGQPEIYVMNADGSGQVRLTFNSGTYSYDDMPVWSPDGSKIAFVSSRSGGYRIWVMDADGSNPVQLSAQPNSFDPQWSPDGTQILYDAGIVVNNVYFQRLYRMDASGANQTSLPVDTVDSFNTTDVYASGWSPDGRYVYYCIVAFINQTGTWYWTYASAYYAYATTPNVHSNLSPDSVDWDPAWETYDTQIPSAIIDPLPAVSPSPFHLSWSRFDLNPSYVDVDIQYRDNNSPWQVLFNDANGSYTYFNGYGGHTYTFRVRANDGFYQQSDWVESPTPTTVENLPPVTTLAALPPFTRGTTINLSWNSQDPGGSGIATYDLQYRAGDSPTWTDLLTHNFRNYYTFIGTAGTTYYFRVRAYDNASNQESWPSDPDGDGSTTLYGNKISGTLQDASGTSIAGAVPDLSIAPLFNPPTDADGSYGAYFAPDLSTLSATWSKTGYGELPPFYLNPNSDHVVNAYLPPADDAVLNGGFENGSLGASDWTASGDVSPAVTGNSAHSGNYGVQLGAQSSLENSTALGDQYAKMVVDGAGGVHTVSSGDSDQYYYARRDTTGAWSTRQPLPLVKPSTHTIIALDMDANSTLNAIFATSGEIYVLQLPLNGSWSVSPVLYTPAYYFYYKHLIKSVMEPNGRWHVIMAFEIAGQRITISSALFANGAWLPTQTLATVSMRTQLEMQLVVSPLGEADLVVINNDSSYPDQDHLWHSHQSGANPWWSLGEFTYTYDYNYAKANMVISSSGVTSLVWLNNAGQLSTNIFDVYFTQKPNGGSWSTPVKINEFSFYGSDMPQIAVSPNGAVAITYKVEGNNGPFEYGSGIYLLERDSTGAWSTPALIPGSSYMSHTSGQALAIDVNNRVHIV